MENRHGYRPGTSGRKTSTAILMPSLIVTYTFSSSLTPRGSGGLCISYLGFICVFPMVICTDDLAGCCAINRPARRKNISPLACHLDQARGEKLGKTADLSPIPEKVWRPDHSGLILARLTTPPHMLISLSIHSANASGVLVAGSIFSLVSRSCRPGWASALARA